MLIYLYSLFGLQSVSYDFRLHLLAADDPIELFGCERFAILHLLIDNLIAAAEGIAPGLFVGDRSIV